MRFFDLSSVGKLAGIGPLVAMVFFPATATLAQQARYQPPPSTAADRPPSRPPVNRRAVPSTVRQNPLRGADFVSPDGRSYPPPAVRVAQRGAIVENYRTSEGDMTTRHHSVTTPSGRTMSFDRTRGPDGRTMTRQHSFTTPQGRTFNRETTQIFDGNRMTQQRLLTTPGGQTMNYPRTRGPDRRPIDYPRPQQAAGQVMPRQPDYRPPRPDSFVREAPPRYPTRPTPQHGAFNREATRTYDGQTMTQQRTLTTPSGQMMNFERIRGPEGQTMTRQHNFTTPQGGTFNRETTRTFDGQTMTQQRSLTTPSGQMPQRMPSRPPMETTRQAPRYSSEVRNRYAGGVTGSGRRSPSVNSRSTPPTSRMPSSRDYKMSPRPSSRRSSSDFFNSRVTSPSGGSMGHSRGGGRR